MRNAAVNSIGYPAGLPVSSQAPAVANNTPAIPNRMPSFNANSNPFQRQTPMPQPQQNPASGYRMPQGQRGYFGQQPSYGLNGFGAYREPPPPVPVVEEEQVLLPEEALPVDPALLGMAPPQQQLPPPQPVSPNPLQPAQPAQPNPLSGTIMGGNPLSGSILSPRDPINGSILGRR
jgi:hypothetical protein